MTLKNFFLLLFNPKNVRLLVSILLVTLIILLIGQCERAATAERETTRISNNWKASQDTIRNFKDKNDNSVAEIRALNLTLEEVKKELEFEKNKPPITVIRYKTKIVEKIVEVPVVITDITDTTIEDFNSVVKISSESSWDQSARKIKITVPYLFNGGEPIFGDATIDLEQDIFLTASLLRDRKTGEVFVNLLTDYPGVRFNSAQGIVIDQKGSGFRDLQYQNRKSLGLGIQLGLGLTEFGVSPYVGVGINYTPKFLQL